MRVGLTGNDSLSRRCLAAAEARATQIKTTPEEMNRAAFADKLSAEFLKHSLGGKQYSPQAIGVFRIVRCMSLILIEQNRIRNFLRFRIELYVDARRSQSPKSFVIKRRN